MRCPARQARRSAATPSGFSTTMVTRSPSVHLVSCGSRVPPRRPGTGVAVRRRGGRSSAIGSPPGTCTRSTPMESYRHLGRRDDMLKVGGEWVSPAEVESVLLGHESVAEAAVVGAARQRRTDSHRGLRGAATRDALRRRGRAGALPRRACGLQASAPAHRRRDPSEDRDRQGDSSRSPARGDAGAQRRA